MTTSTKRILCAAGAAVVALALAIGGTFAYTAYEHKSNPMRNNPNYQGRLVEDFDPDPDWEVDHAIKKEVSVKNMGGTDQYPGANWGDIYVRVKLKEHMDLTPIQYIYYPASDPAFNTRFMVDKDGDFVRFEVGAGTAPDMAAIRGDAIWSNVITDPAKRAAFIAGLQASDFIKLKGYYDDQEYWYLVTKENDPNGQYGAFVVIDKVADPSKMVSITGSTRAAGVDYSKGIVTYDPSDHDNDECLYPTHMWEQAGPELCGLDSHRYVSWQLGASIILAGDWDGDPVDKWILDPVTGWATWGNALKPGDSTDLLLETITPILYPDGEMLYVIHVDMQATDLAEMLTGDWNGDDWIIKDAFDRNPNVAVTGVSINPSSKTMAPGDTFKLTAVVGPANATNKKVTWTSSNPAVAEVDSDGNVTAKTEGAATITATTEDGGKTGDCAITVTTGTIPATNVTITGPKTVELEIGQTYTVPFNVTPPGTTDTPSWSSAASGIASVTNAGVIKGESAGTTTVTVTLRPGVSDTITVVVKPATDPLLPLKPGPFEPEHNDNPTYEYSMVISGKDYDFDNADVIQAGAIKLRDVLTSAYPAADYDQITVAPKAGSGLSASLFTIGKDKSGTDYAILYEYYGTQGPWDAALAAVAGGSDFIPPTFPVTLVLSAPGYTPTEINVTLTYIGSMYTG